MNNTIFYHYSSKPFDRILTLRQQQKEGLKIPYTVDELDARDEFQTVFKKTIPYSRHVSLHIDPLPIEVVKKNFPAESPYFKNRYLYEHIVDLNEYPHNELLFQIVETDYDTLMVDFLFSENLWDNSDVYVKGYYRLRNLIKYFDGNKGETLNEFLISSDKYRGRIKSYFEKWVKREDFIEHSHMYSATVPHAMVCPVDGYFKVSSVNKIDMKR